MFVFLLCFLLSNWLSVLSLSNKTPQTFVFVILSHPSSQHMLLAEKKKNNLLEQSKLLTSNEARVFISPVDFPGINGDWTILPIIERLSELKVFDWTLFLEESTEVDVEKLFNLLDQHNSTEEYFLGHALHDEEPTIIHHFDSQGLSYPLLACGFAISFPLIKRAAMHWKENRDISFSIDPKYELAKFLSEKVGVSLLHEPQFCLERGISDCSSWTDFRSDFCGSSVVSEDQVLFAVKTCKKYHKDRVQVVKSTWGKNSKHIKIMYYSDDADSSIPTVKLDVENVEAGHCQKTMLILQDASRNWHNMDWLVIADDDTLLSVPRLLRKLSCYNASDALALGERYGYSVASSGGYDYITGGGGMVFSMSTVHQLATRCVCPSIDSPDDMILGICLKTLQIPIIHSSLFHQARPKDYAVDYLKHRDPISFHKHWMMDPHDVYNMWLGDSKDFHSEL